MSRLSKPLRTMSAAILLGATGVTLAAAPPQSDANQNLAATARLAQQKLQQTFTNLKFEEFGPSPVRGPIYQAIAGGKVIYFAPESEHLLFAAIYDKNGVNQTALTQDASFRKRLGAIDPAAALAIGPSGAPQVIEFTDPDCPYCRALEKFWNVKEAEGKPVRRLVYFVTGIHPQAAAKAQHILCSPDKAAEFKRLYNGTAPQTLRTCESGQEKVEADTALVAKMGISGTPTVIVDGKFISGFQQGELEEWLGTKKAEAKSP